MSKVFIVGEIGINHNDIDIAKQLIDLSADTGLDAVKFQKEPLIWYIHRRCLQEKEKVHGALLRESKRRSRI